MSPFTRFRAPVSGRSLRRQQIALVVLALLSLAGYVWMAFWFPLSPFYRQVPLADVRDFTPSLAAGAAYGLLLLVLYGLYWLAFRLTQQGGLRLRMSFVWGTAVLFSLPLLFTYPFNATDVFRYLIHGRITAFYHTNPYLTPPDAFPQDPFLPLAGEWAGETSPYGPVWEMGAAAIAALTGNDLYAGLLLFKLGGLATFLLCSWLLWLLLADAPPVRRVGLTLLWAWNPALLLVFVVDAHNDALMLLWLLLGYWLWRRGYAVMGLIAMFLAVLTKPIALLPLAFFGLAIWRSLPGRAARVRFLMITAVTTLLLTFFTFLPFGSPFLLAARLAREASHYPGFSPVTLILLFIPEWGALTMERYTLIVNLGRLLFLLLAGWLTWRAWHGRNPLRAAADIFFAYLLTTPAFRIWYAAWPFPWLLLDEGGQKEAGSPTVVSYRLRVGLWFLLTTQLSVIIYGHLHHYRLGEASFPTHFIGVPLTFGLPFVLAWQRKRSG